jgi:hypothetical protein
MIKILEQPISSSIKSPMTRKTLLGRANSRYEYSSETKNLDNKLSNQKDLKTK